MPPWMVAMVAHSQARQCSAVPTSAAGRRAPSSVRVSVGADALPVGKRSGAAPYLLRWTAAALRTEHTAHQGSATWRRHIANRTISQPWAGVG